jgi:hypothetical protein
MKHIVLFRYHGHPDRNLELLRFQKFLNPTVSFYGLFGGSEQDFPAVSKALESVLEGNFLIRDRSTEWKWKHSDMAYQLWHREVGHTLDFDAVHVLEWDILYFEPLHRLFPQTRPDTVILTGLTQMANVENKWYWTRDPENREEWIKLLDHFRINFRYDQAPYAALGCGITLPREYLDRLVDEEIPFLSNDELRIPLYAQAFGLRMADSCLCRRWFSRLEDRFWNANRKEISWLTIRWELAKKTGRRAFHPVTRELRAEKLIRLYNAIS